MCLKTRLVGVVRYFVHLRIFSSPNRLSNVVENGVAHPALKVAKADFAMYEFFLAEFVLPTGRKKAYATDLS